MKQCVYNSILFTFLRINLKIIVKKRDFVDPLGLIRAQPSYKLIKVETFYY